MPALVKLASLWNLLQVEGFFACVVVKIMIPFFGYPKNLVRYYRTTTHMRGLGLRVGVHGEANGKEHRKQDYLRRRWGLKVGKIVVPLFEYPTFPGTYHTRYPKRDNDFDKRLSGA